ncbi:MAG: hypothetical protein M1822_009323 [Bathelium mastoideum]|nr:MAG: hypothetical protein M1822_009323 [Bathelium mastoideum]
MLTPSPRARDRLGFSTDKQTEMKNRLSTHSDRFNLFLTHLNSGALGRIETNQEIHTVAFGEIKSKLDSIHEDIREGRKDPSLLSNMGDWGALEQELVDDRITEVDVELNKDEIAEWVKQTCGEDEVNRREENARDMSRFQAAVEDANDESLKQESVKEINPDGIDGDTSPMAAFKIPTRNFAEAIAHEDSPSSEVREGSSN